MFEIYTNIADMIRSASETLVECIGDSKSQSYIDYVLNMIRTLTTGDQDQIRNMIEKSEYPMNELFRDANLADIVDAQDREEDVEVEIFYTRDFEQPSFKVLMKTL